MLDIGTNDIEQMSANLVISRLSKEAIEENGCGMEDMKSDTCWRDSMTVMKLIDLKIKHIKKYGVKLDKKILIMIKTDYSRV